MKKIRAVFLGVAFYLFSFLTASAHVKWFVEEERIPPIPVYTPTSTPVLVWVGVLALMLLLGWYLDKHIGTPRWLKNFVHHHGKLIHKTAQFLLGLFLLVTVSFFWDTIVAPYVPVDNTFRVIITLLQVILGVMFMLDFHPRIASGVLMVLCALMGVYSGAVVFFENLLLCSLAYYFLVTNSKDDSRLASLKPSAYQVLRIGTAICLIVLAFTEKLLHPEFSLIFLDAHHWNFMQPIFPSFSNSLFVLSVGMSELLFGILILCGSLLRITTLALAVFLISSATAMFLSVGDWEPGHVVIYAVALLFVFFGTKDHPALTKKD